MTFNQDMNYQENMNMNNTTQGSMNMGNNNTQEIMNMSINTTQENMNMSYTQENMSVGVNNNGAYNASYPVEDFSFLTQNFDNAVLQQNMIKQIFKSALEEFKEDFMKEVEEKIEKAVIKTLSEHFSVNSSTSLGNL